MAPGWLSQKSMWFYFILLLLFFFNDSHREREREAETQADGEAGSMHREPNVGFDPGSPGSRPGPKAGAKPLRHPGIPVLFLKFYVGVKSCGICLSLIDLFHLT